MIGELEREAQGPERAAQGMDPPWAFAGRRTISFPTRMVKAIGSVAVVLALLGAGLAYLSPKSDHHGHVLALSFVKGHDDRFELKAVLNGTQTVGGASQTLHETMAGVLTLHVVSVSADGVATVKVTVRPTSDRVNGGSEHPGTFEELIKVQPDGRITSRSEHAPQDLRDPGSVLLGLRQLTPILPSGPVEPGASWKRSFDQMVRYADEPVRVSSRNNLLSYETVARSATAAVTNDVTVPLSFGMKPSRLLGPDDAMVRRNPGARFLATGSSSLAQTAWLNPTDGVMTSSATLGRFDLTLAIAGAPDTSDLAGVTGRIKGTLSVNLSRIGAADAGSSARTAPDAAARDALRQALAAADLYFIPGQTYTGFTASKGSSLLPALHWAKSGRAGVMTVTVRRAKGLSLLLVTSSRRGHPLCIANTAAGVRYGTSSPSRAVGCHGGW